MQATIFKRWAALIALTLITTFLLSFLFNHFLPDHGLWVDLIFFAMVGLAIAGFGKIIFRD